MASPGVEREGGVAGTKRAVGEAQGGEGSETQGTGKKRLEARGANVAMERKTKQRCPASLTAGASKQQPAKLTIAEVMRFNARPQEPRAQLSAEKKRRLGSALKLCRGRRPARPCAGKLQVICTTKRKNSIPRSRLASGNKKVKPLSGPVTDAAQQNWCRFCALGKPPRLLCVWSTGCSCVRGRPPRLLYRLMGRG